MAKLQLADGQWVPAKYEVCGRCRGEGTHTNPAIDGNGISSEEMYELGDDFREDYMAGVYDVQCEECKGERLVLVIDEERATPEQMKAWHSQQEEEANYRAERASELRWGY